MFIMQMPPTLSHDLMTIDWLFLRLLNALFSCNVRLLQFFRHGVLMEVRSCSMSVKNSTKMELSEGGGIQSDFL